jgi:tRNA dimethylallyltransferase
MLIILTGPTATGKTALSVKLAKHIDGEIVNADAMQVYRGMNIGTAKPSDAERDGVPHHLFDIAEPTERYTVSRYIENASNAVDNIVKRGKTPILVGGTLLYIDSLLSGRNFADTDATLRAELETLPDPYAELAKADSAAAAIIHPNNRRRAIRALEVLRLTGKSILEHDANTKTLPPRYEAIKFALNYEDRAVLYAKIDARVDAMMSAGLLDEVKQLSELPGFNSAAIGYKELQVHLRGERSLADAVAQIKQASRNYAKRQLTWLRSEAAIKWITWTQNAEFANSLQFMTYFAMNM